MRLREFSKSPRWLYVCLFVLGAGILVYRLTLTLREPEPSFRMRPVEHSAHASALGYPKRPNIFLILIDTLRADHLGAYGYSRPTSPAIDRLAGKEGILFERAYSVAPWTNPTIATLFTGKYPQSVFAPAPHGEAIRQALPKNIETVAEVVKEAGYRTVALVDHPGINQRLGYARGFAEFRVLFRESGVDFWTRTDPEFVLEVFKEVSENVGVSDDPVFIYLHLVYPHRPYTPAPRYAEMFGSGFTRIEKIQRDGVINMYDAEIRQTDDLLGKMFADMRNQGWYDETAIIFTADHGEGFWEHGLAEHGRSFFDEEIRIPLIVVPPGGRTEEPAEIERPVSNVGVFATVLDFAGITPEVGVHGRSLLRFFHPHGVVDSSSGTDWFFSESPHSGDIHAAAALNSLGEKYIHYQKPSFFPAEMLFDVTEDPSETRNLAGESSRLSAYRSLLQQHMEMNRAALAASDRDTVDVDEETLERLRALGYVN
jgi:choline-sulfatase